MFKLKPSKDKGSSEKEDSQVVQESSEIKNRRWSRKARQKSSQMEASEIDSLYSTLKVTEPPKENFSEEKVKERTSIMKILREKSSIEMMDDILSNPKGENAKDLSATEFYSSFHMAGGKKYNSPSNSKKTYTDMTYVSTLTDEGKSKNGEGIGNKSIINRANSASMTSRSRFKDLNVSNEDDSQEKDLSNSFGPIRRRTSSGKVGLTLNDTLRYTEHVNFGSSFDSKHSVEIRPSKKSDSADGLKSIRLRVKEQRDNEEI